MSKDLIEKLIQAKELAAKMVAEQNVPVAEGESLYKLGAKLFVRTVTYHYTGRITFLSEKEMVLSDASWIADSGRFSKALESGELDEVEPYPGPCSIVRDTIVDVSPWNHELPKVIK